MTRRSGFTPGSAFFMQLALGIFFLSLGLMGLTHYDSGLGKLARFFGRDDTMRVLTAVIELVMGAVLVIGLFAPVSPGLARLFSLALFGLWALYMLLTFVLDGFLEPDLLPWLYNVSWNSVILAGLWQVGRKYMA